jgi:hypothetical protein
MMKWQSMEFSLELAFEVSLCRPLILVFAFASQVVNKLSFCRRKSIE